MLSQLEFDAGWAPSPGDLDAFPGGPRVDFGACMQSELPSYPLQLSLPYLGNNYIPECKH
jgi:hypothetical protein